MNTLPRNAGAPWTQEEEDKLMTALSNNKSINDIAVEHSRTSGAINSRVRQIAVRLFMAQTKKEIHITLKF